MKPPVTPVRGRLFGARAASEYLGISAHKVRSLIASGALVAVRSARGRLEGVYQTDCDAWIEQHRHVPLQTRPAVDDRIAALLPKDRRFI